MEKLIALITALGIALTADQTAQIKEVVGKEFVPAADHAAQKTKLDELAKQLAERDKDLEKLKTENKSEDLTKQLEELKAKYKTDTDDLNAKLAAMETDHAAEMLFGEYKFANERVRKSVLEEFKTKGFKFENGAFIGGREFLEGLKTSEPDIFAAEKPGLFMGSTQSTVPENVNNTAAQISAAFGLKNNVGGK